MCQRQTLKKTEITFTRELFAVLTKISGLVTVEQTGNIQARKLS